VEYAIAVIDIGMTNKKIALYDQSLNQLDAHYKNFDPLIVDSLECHNLEEMENWFIEELKYFAGKYPVKAVSISTHGATFVCTGKDGKAAVPCVYYTHEPSNISDEDFHGEFYKRFGKKEELQSRTGTPAFKAMINPAKGIYFIQKKYPDEFKNVTSVIPYPQYWGFRFTGNIAAETTYLGNHTYLWDQTDSRYSGVAHNLGIASLMPEKICKPWDVLGKITEDLARKTSLSKDTIVTMGIHDSNSALLPHFAKKGTRGFILNSTGTWCVIMNPVEKYEFKPDELGKVVFFNISANGTPLKTAIFLGGLEFETWSQLFSSHHKRSDNPEWNENLYRSILKEKKLFLLPELTQGSGQFPDSRARITENGRNYYFDSLETAQKPPCFSDYEKLFASLRISLVMQTITALKRAGLDDACEIFTEGGFRKDESYSRLLSSALANKVFLTDISEASALGAAMIAKMALKKISLSDLSSDFEISYNEQSKGFFPELEEYRKAWLSEAEKTQM